MIRCVIFDLDNTLYDYDEGYEAAIRAASDYAKELPGFSGESFREIESAMNACLRAEMGERAAIHNRLIRFENILERRGLPLYPHALKLYNLYWDSFLQKARPYPQTLPVLRALKERGIRTGIGTDMTALIQYRKLEKMELLSFFDFMVSSEEAGFEKPAAGFFEMCLKKAGCEMGECLFVGDHPEKDAAGASRFGLLGVWLNRKGRKDHGELRQISSLDGLMAYL